MAAAWAPIETAAAGVATDAVLRRPDRVDRGVFGCGLVVIAALVATLASTGHRDVAVACGCAPIGCIARFKTTSAFDGAGWNWLPKGTLLVNVVVSSIFFLPFGLFWVVD